MLRQWPGTYFETSFVGDDVYFRHVSGDVNLRLTVDSGPSQYLVKPAAGFYHIPGLPRGEHTLRIDIGNESQKSGTTFGGFFAPPGTRARRVGRRALQIEFIGDSFTVGYGNTSPTGACSEQEVWRTTNTSQGIAGLTARELGADYQVNAISGRGVVRNFYGGPGDVVPQAYGL